MSKRILYWLTFFVTCSGIALAGISVIAWIYVRFVVGDSSVPVMMLYVPCVIGLAVAATGVVRLRRTRERRYAATSGLDFRTLRPHRGRRVDRDPENVIRQALSAAQADG